MNDQQHRHFSRYVRDIADRMRLRDWTVTLSDEHPDDKEADADARVTYGRRCLTLRLARDFAVESPEDQRHTVVHELIHAHLFPIDWTVNSIGNHLPLAALDILKGALSDDIEVGVDALADVIAPFMPLPAQETP